MEECARRKGREIGCYGGQELFERKEVDSLNRLSNAFIDIAEQRAEDHILMTMADWSALLQRYMDLNNRPLLSDAGRVTHE